jgi:hypothetical protein
MYVCTDLAVCAFVHVWGHKEPYRCCMYVCMYARMIQDTHTHIHTYTHIHIQTQYKHTTGIPPYITVQSVCSRTHIHTHQHTHNTHATGVPPYVTGLSVFAGIWVFGLQGAVYGPLFVNILPLLYKEIAHAFNPSVSENASATPRMNIHRRLSLLLSPQLTTPATAKPHSKVKRSATWN